MSEENLAAVTSVALAMGVGVGAALFFKLTEPRATHSRLPRVVWVVLGVAAGALMMVVIEAMSRVSPVEINPAFMLSGTLLALACVASRRSSRLTGTRYKWNALGLGLAAAVLFWVAWDWQRLEAKRDAWQDLAFATRGEWLGASPHDITYPLLWLLLLAGVVQLGLSLRHKLWARAALVVTAFCLVYWFRDNLATYVSSDDYADPNTFWFMGAALAFGTFLLLVFVEWIMSAWRRRKQAPVGRHTYIANP